MAITDGYIGFSINGKHSLQFNLYRVLKGSRHQYDLLPSIKNELIEVPGGDGQYYFGKNYGNRNISIDVAYDNLTTDKKRDIVELFSSSEVFTLIFDESPYKIYRVIMKDSPTLNFIPFEEKGKTVWKGEGTINFITIGAFAQSRFKYLDEYTDDNIPEWGYIKDTLTDWVLESGIKVRGNYDTFSSGGYITYNPGTVETPFKLKFEFDSEGKIPDIRIYISETAEKQLEIKDIARKGNDWGIQINAENHLIEGINSSGEITGTIYNEKKIGGNFFKIGKGENHLYVSGGALPTDLEYDYLYV